MAAIAVRAGNRTDLPRVAEIQRASPEAARWNPEDYLGHVFAVAVRDEEVVGFVVLRAVAHEECEILNLAVHPNFRRQGVARSLLEHVRRGCAGAIYLEVRESNRTALKFYKAIGFKEVGRRPAYYEHPPEGAIVMKFLSC